MKWVLGIILFVGGIFRFYNLNWDDGHFFHPDERNIALAVTRIHFFDQMNPEFFAYGSFPMYLYRAAADVVVAVTGNPSWVSDWGKINLVGRYFSAFFSTLTIFLVYLLAKKIFSQHIAIVAAWFTATTPFLIQQAHFATTESMLAFWAVLITYLTMQNARPAILGYVLGLAMATKMSAISFLVIPLFQKRKTFLIALLCAFGTFVLFSPYTFLSWNKFMESMRYEGGIVSGKLVVVYVYQFLNTKPYLYQLTQFFYTQGPVLAVASILGTLLLLKGRRSRFVFLWPLLYFAYVGGWYAKFVRYLVPIYPFLAMTAAYFVSKVPKLRILFLIATFLQSIAFMNIYVRQQTRIAASNWIYANVPKGATALTEHWDDGLPISYSPEKDPNIFKTMQLTVYEPDDEKKAEYYAQNLSQAEYLFINSRRLYGTLMYLTEKYPVTSKYYKLLFNGSLGYKKVAEFSVYPGFNDDKSEESFQVYDHPKVMIFQNTSRLSKEQIQKLLL